MTLLMRDQEMIKKGREEGLAEGKQLLANAIRRLQDGETAEQLIASGLDSDTVELALTFKFQTTV